MTTQAPTQANRPLAVGTPLGEDALLITSFDFSEELGRPFSMRVSARVTKAEHKAEALLAQNVTVRLRAQDDKTTRYFNGHVARVAQRLEGGIRHFDLTVVPALWLLTRSADCRIFQDTTLPDILKKVLEARGVKKVQLNLKATYSPIPYCVQYRETDFNFVSRLMEQHGIYYFHTHEDKAHTLVLCDGTKSHDPLADPYKALKFDKDDDSLAHDEFGSFRVESEFLTGKAALSDFNFEKPTMDLNRDHKVGTLKAAEGYEIYDYPGEYQSDGAGTQAALVRAEEIDAGSEVFAATTPCRAMHAGRRFDVANAKDNPSTAAKAFLVTAVSLHAEAGDYESGGGGGGGGGTDYSCSFRAIDAERPFRAPRLTPKPMIAGPQTAIVVGPAGDEIHADKHGRVKVKFHWDRKAKADEKASCFIRVAQVWAGKGWGGLYTPRIGQEVVVEFLEGDPDQPLITGRVYNGDNPPPYDPSAAPTKSTLKSLSSKGGGGFNELRFEDKKGEEQVFIHAEKDAHRRVKNDDLTWTGHDSHLWVINDSFADVKGNRHEIVEKSHFEEIIENRHLTIAGFEHKEVLKNVSLIVHDDVAEEFNKNQSTMVQDDLYIKAQNIVLEAGTNITIKVGTTSIAFEENGVSIKTNGNVKVDGMTGIELTSAGGDFKAKGLNAAVGGTIEAKLEGAAIAVVKGGMVMIN